VCGVLMRRPEAHFLFNGLESLDARRTTHDDSENEAKIQSDTRIFLRALALRSRQCAINLDSLFKRIRGKEGRIIHNL
jgi:hypothetical protein